MATTTSTTATPSPATARLPRLLVAGLAGGIVGGIVFGALMAMMGMLPMVAGLIGSDSHVVGLGIHIAISAAAGLAFGALLAVAPALSGTPARIAVAGAAYGVAWWVGGALIAMPLLLGMTAEVLAVGQPQLMSLVGHVLFGVVMGVTVSRSAR